MDKNMINIDDLFRQGLSGGEDKERPGAWLQMRELLDKEMPVAAGNTTNWRRMFGYAAGLVLLASASIGGYTAYTSFRDAEKQLPATVAVNTTNPGGFGGSSAMVVTGKTEQKIETATAIANSTSNIPAGQAIDNNGVVAKTHNSQQTVAQQPVVNTTKRNISGKTVTTVTTVAATKTTTNDNKLAETRKNTASTGKSNINQPTVAISIGGASNASNATAAKATTTPVATSNSANKSSTATTSNTPTQEKMFASAAPTTNDNKKPVAAQLQNKPSASVGASAASSAKNEVAKNDNHKKNLIDKVEERETYDRKTGLWKKDTIDQGKVEWKKQEDLIVANVDKPADNTATAIVPAAAVAVKSENEAEKLVALSNFRTSSKNSNYETHNFFEEMVKNAKLQLGGVRFYPGLIVGINTALSGKNSMTGFQVGVTGNLSLNEKWGIVSELKYMQRFKNGNRESNRNDYITNTQSVNNGQSYQWDSVVSYFTYPTVSSVELPVMFKYSHNRFNVLAGANLAYYMGFSPNHVEQPYRLTGAKPPITPAEGGAIMSSSDFGSRFGVGYLFGVGYQVSPAVQLDMRMSQSVWDNAAGAGAARVSKEVFQLPSLQFNMSYRFSSNKYKPYRQQ
ncbi:outer membrane beta-barrel protein [Polluticoccus soli]|uniref:outer membrane beta-barrel protein n=1 Tax=Polluticoccus soli TaxID=3034150 RepID=UPI0023E0E7C1|nr:outer membrane beta-barrel protein [Flavipsychrobacter sp. JY13-12]